MDIKIKRTGNLFSIASYEYLVTFPDGTQQRIWSPPWNNFTEEEEDEEALLYAKKIWLNEN